MSKIALKPNASGTGVFSLEAPNSNVDRTLTLPDEAGSVLTDVSDIEPQVKTATNATGSAPVYACRAWVNFNGKNTVSIRDSGNVSSITDRGTGIYSINFTTDMPDNNYAASLSCDDLSAVASLITINLEEQGIFSASSLGFECALADSSTSRVNVDVTFGNVGIFR